MLSANVFAKLVIPLSLAAFSIWCTANSVGLFHFISLPYILCVAISLVIFDFVIYWQHRMFHVVPLLWRFHKVHHADAHVDTTTALRFHPIEIVISLVIKIIVVALIGVPPEAVLCFEILLNAFAMFNHANIRLPKTIEVWLERVVVSQRLHRIHHSQIECETNSNYGFSVVFWDKLFASYTHRAHAKDKSLKVGLVEYPASKQNASIKRLLMMPFKEPR